MNYLKEKMVKDLTILSSKLEEESLSYLRKSKDIEDCWYGKAMGLQAGQKEIDKLIRKYEELRDE